MVQSALT